MCLLLENDKSDSKLGQLIIIYPAITGEVSYTVFGATAPPTFRCAPPTLCYAPPTFVIGLVFFWLPNEHFPPQARKAIGIKDFLALKLLFASVFKDTHQLTWHFASSSTNFCRKAPPMPAISSYVRRHSCSKQLNLNHGYFM